MCQNSFLAMCQNPYYIDRIKNYSIIQNLKSKQGLTHAIYYKKTSISYELASQLVQAAIEHAKTLNN